MTIYKLTQINTRIPPTYYYHLFDIWRINLCSLRTLYPDFAKLFALVHGVYGNNKFYRYTYFNTYKKQHIDVKIIIIDVI